jgi:hypothetical protein
LYRWMITNKRREPENMADTELGTEVGKPESELRRQTTHICH